MAYTPRIPIPPSVEPVLRLMQTALLAIDADHLAWASPDITLELPKQVLNSARPAQLTNFPSITIDAITSEPDTNETDSDCEVEQHTIEVSLALVACDAEELTWKLTRYARAIRAVLQDSALNWAESFYVNRVVYDEIPQGSTLLRVATLECVVGY